MIPSLPPEPLLDTETKSSRRPGRSRRLGTASCGRVLKEICDIKGMSLTWSDAILRVRHGGEGLMFDVLGDCLTSLDGSVYELQKVCLLSPSMHRIRSEFSALEVQLVHQSVSGDQLTLAALFREGKPTVEVDVALASLLFRQSAVRLIDLVPLGRSFYIHDASDPADGITGRNLHLISAFELEISPIQLSKLRTM